MRQSTVGEIRPYTSSDEEGVVKVWHRAGQATYTSLPLWRGLSLAGAREVFREVILPGSQIWVAFDRKVVAYMALRGSYIDRLYIDPYEHRMGWGTRLLEKAKEQHPEGLELHTHRDNPGARAFYEQHGFVAVAFGTSPPPESAPDVEYHWRPAQPAQEEEMKAEG